jgi:hypothetical protein
MSPSITSMRGDVAGSAMPQLYRPGVTSGGPDRLSHPLEMMEA